MTDSLLKSPMNPGKQVKCLKDMRKNDHRQTACADGLRPESGGHDQQKELT